MKKLLAYKITDHYTFIPSRCRRNSRCECCSVRIVHYFCLYDHFQVKYVSMSNNELKQLLLFFLSKT